uniref:Zgc:194242 n=1 Tax=Erpetoichthys calabaricus TaxID=27687 RepID=A0A8C4S364_ERPCA
MLLNKLTQQLGHPRHSFTGWLVKTVLENINETLEGNAAKLVQIQPDNTVLEVGFGPGLGLQKAIHYLTESKGILYGLDYSEYIHNVASKRLQEQIASGKTKLLLGSVEKIPLPDSSVDRVFHCNCYYYWPDLKTCSAELHRVMKPDCSSSHKEQLWEDEDDDNDDEWTPNAMLAEGSSTSNDDEELQDEL